MIKSNPVYREITNCRLNGSKKLTTGKEIEL